MANGMLVLPRKLWSLQPTVDTTMSVRAWRAFGVWTTGKCVEAQLLQTG